MEPEDHRFFGLAEEAGMPVGVFERSGRLGGAAVSGPGPLRGYTMNHYAHWTRFYSHPAYRDFDLHAEGLRYVEPCRLGLAFAWSSASLVRSRSLLTGAGWRFRAASRGRCSRCCS